MLFDDCTIFGVRDKARAAEKHLLLECRSNVRACSGDHFIERHRRAIHLEVPRKLHSDVVVLDLSGNSTDETGEALEVDFNNFGACNGEPRQRFGRSSLDLGLEALEEVAAAHGK